MTLNMSELDCLNNVNDLFHMEECVEASNLRSFVKFVLVTFFLKCKLGISSLLYKLLFLIWS